MPVTVPASFGRVRRADDLAFSRFRRRDKTSGLERHLRPPNAQFVAFGQQMLFDFVAADERAILAVKVAHEPALPGVFDLRLDLAVVPGEEDVMDADIAVGVRR